MSWLTKTLSSSLGRKVIMSLTGLFLIIFLLVHLIGNLQLLKDDGGQAFNIYAKFMTTNGLIKVSSYLLYATFLIHIVYSIILTRVNRSARPSSYAYSKPSGSSSLSSRNMGILGTVIFIFLVIHLQNFWYQMKFGSMPMTSYGGMEIKDLYRVVAEAFSQWWYVVVYVTAMVFLAFHLSHGFQSAFQTLGINHKKYTPFIQKVGLAYSIVIPGLFALIPIYMFFTCNS